MQWVNPFLGCLTLKQSGYPTQAIHGIVVRVSRDSLLFQTFEPVPESAADICIAWGEAHGEKVPVSRLELTEAGNYGAKYYTLYVSDLSDRRRYASRKNEQMATATLWDHQDRLSAALARIHLPYSNFIDAQISPGECARALSCEFLGKTVDAPFYIVGMTGGSPETDKINRRIAAAAAQCGIPMAVGSQRWVLDRAREDDLNLRKALDYPDRLPIIGNIGISELIGDGSGGGSGGGSGVLSCIAERTGVDAIAVHLNILQEIIQWEGERDFTDSYEKLKSAVSDSPVPIIIKETGCGFSAEVFRDLLSWPIYAVELTSQAAPNWIILEGMRASSKWSRYLSRDFMDVGYDAAHQLDLMIQFRGQEPRPRFIMSGGVSQGVHAAKILFAGADMCAIGRAALRALMDHGGDVNALVEYLTYMKQSIYVAMVLAQKSSIEELRGAWGSTSR